MIVTLISGIGFIASLMLGIRELTTHADERALRRSGIAWGVVFCALQLFVAIWSGIGLVQQDIVSAVLFAVITTLCAWGSFARARLSRLVARQFDAEGPLRHPLAASVIALVFAGIFATLALEIPSNHDLMWMYPLCLLLEVSLLTAAMAGVFFLAQRHGAAPAIIAGMFHFVGIAEYFVILFKSMPIQPGDLSALSTAAAVAGTGYTYTLSAFCLFGMAFAAISFFLCQLAGTICAVTGAVPSRKRVGVNILVGLLCLAGIGAHVTLIDYYNTLGIQIYTWRPLESYYRQGFIPSFISSAQTIIPPKPENYDSDEAQALLDEYAATYDAGEGASTERAEATAQFDEEQPTVIAVMNETFSDLSIYQNLHANYEGPQFFKSISDAVLRGRLYVSAYGGGTANTEFEFLTGNAMAYLGQGVYPYTIYNLTQTGNLAQQFKELGYDTCAMHPNHATNWNRENVYRDFGFDEFLTIDDFQDAEKLRGMVTDAATYDTILDMLEENENPQFIFDVTMQNHSGYTTGLLPYDKQTNYLIDGTYDAEVNEYLALIEESDRALEEFINELEQLNRKVVVVFFGDHQPFFPSEYNDAWFTNEDEATHAERLWQTDYVIWANYDVAGSAQTSEELDTSINYLGALLMNAIGAPLTDYQKAQLAVRDVMPAINTTGFEDRSGTWYLAGVDEKDVAAAGGDGKDVVKARSDLSKMQYLELFDHDDGIFTKTTQDAANETDPNLDPGTTKIK